MRSRPWPKLPCELERLARPNAARGSRRVLLSLCLALAALPAAAEPTGSLSLDPAPDLSAFEQERIVAVQVETEGPLWQERLGLKSVAPGDPASAEVARRAISELTETGRFAEVRAAFSPTDRGVLLVLRARPRRIIASIVFEGNRLELAEAERALGLEAGGDVTALGLERAGGALAEAHRTGGFSAAVVEIVPESTDDPMRVLLRVQVRAGEADRVAERRFLVDPFPSHPVLGALLDRFELDEGDRIDRQRLRQASEHLTRALAASGFYEANVSAQVTPGRALVVKVDAGPRFELHVEGNQSFDARTLEQALNLPEQQEVSVDFVDDRLSAFYQRYGFYDVEVRTTRRDSVDRLSSDLTIRVREGELLRVVSRSYPCLSGTKSARELDREVDGVLQENFAAPHLVGPPNQGSMSAELEGGSLGLGERPLEVAPYSRYSQEAYAAVREHLQNLLRSEGYLTATVLSERVLRRTCSPFSQPGVCVPLGPARPQPISCTAPEVNGTAVHTCIPGPGVRCESSAELQLPIVAGPLTSLADITIEGNDHFTKSELLSALNLEIGKPVRRAELDQAITRVRDLYAEAAYAFADVDSQLDVSDDGTRARLLLLVTERQPVRVSRIVIEGARRTREGLIRRRIVLREGELYRKSLARRTQDLVDSLGVFANVSVALEDPRVPAREKTVVVSVSERLPQYLDLKAGVSSGDGFRVGFEYGHRNLGREAIQLTLRSQLGLRPSFLIVEPDVRERYSRINVGELLERRNSISVSLPEIGLGPLFRLEIEALDLRDNQRDFAQVRDALVPRLLFRPSRQWNFSLSASVERNDVSLFALLFDPGLEAADAEAQRRALEDALQKAGVRVPLGVSLAFAQEIAATWDRRDRPLSPTRGTILGATLEHVTAIPLEANVQCQKDGKVFDPTCSELLRISGRASAYLPLGNTGLVLAVGVRAGGIRHLPNGSDPQDAWSRTYPDRLFFMGGVDTLRGFPQDSVVPEDVAQELLKQAEFGINDVVLRGGDIFWNPRFELRIPLGGNLETAVFLDSGNLWADASRFSAFSLRYAIGTGLRYQTPIGPLVFDYGFNLDRVLDELLPNRTNQRTWEALGAFHFSIGYF